MKTRVDALITFPRPAKAANEEFVPDVEKIASGWDAYEVWRTRIKALQHPLSRAAPRNG